MMIRHDQSNIHYTSMKINAQNVYKTTKIRNNTTTYLHHLRLEGVRFIFYGINSIQN